MHKLRCVSFSPVNLSCVNFAINSAKRTQRGVGLEIPSPNNMYIKPTIKFSNVENIFDFYKRNFSIMVGVKTCLKQWM